MGFSGVEAGAAQAPKKGKATNVRARQMLPNSINNLLFSMKILLITDFIIYFLAIGCYSISHLLNIIFLFIVQLPKFVKQGLV